MWFKSKRVRELENKLFELQNLEIKNDELSRALFESQQYERIASEKLTLWVTKHDELLVRYKELVKANKKQ